MSDYVGPCTIDCAERCEVPEGRTLADVPPPRHAWADVLRCPHEGCGRAFLIVPSEQERKG